MKLLITGVLAGGLLFGMTGLAEAGLASNNLYSFSVWSGSYSGGGNALGINGNADLSDAPSGQPSVIFDYTGPLNFTTSGNSDTAGSFFGSNASFITNFAAISNQYASLNDFLANDVLSTSGLSGSSLLTFMEITGTYVASAATPVTVMHESGASLYVGSSDTPLTISPTLAGLTTDSAMLPTTGIAGSSFTLIYVASNGEPSVLRVDQPIPVPEPGSLALLGTAMLGLGFMQRRRRGLVRR